MPLFTVHQCLSPEAIDAPNGTKKIWRIIIIIFHKNELCTLPFFKWDWQTLHQNLFKELGNSIHFCWFCFAIFFSVFGSLQFLLISFSFFGKLNSDLQFERENWTCCKSLTIINICNPLLGNSIVWGPLLFVFFFLLILHLFH